MDLTSNRLTALGFVRRMLQKRIVAAPLAATLSTTTTTAPMLSNEALLNVPDSIDRDLAALGSDEQFRSSSSYDVSSVVELASSSGAFQAAVDAWHQSLHGGAIGSEVNIWSRVH